MRVAIYARSWAQIFLSMVSFKKNWLQWSNDYCTCLWAGSLKCQAPFLDGRRANGLGNPGSILGRAKPRSLKIIEEKVGAFRQRCSVCVCVGGGARWCGERCEVEGGCDNPSPTFPDTGRYNGVLLGKTRFVGKLMVKLSWSVKRGDNRGTTPNLRPRKV